MPDKLPSLFISYSRTDSEFVDRLQADLQARGYDTWVDRKRLEGGQDWADMIQRAIERCQIMLIALSPEAITSEWVKREIAYAQESGKQLLPLMVRHVTQVPIRIQGIQWVDCEGPYERALDRLLFTLTLPVVAPTPAPAIQPAPIPPVPTIEEPQSTDEDLVVARQGPPPPDPNLNALYTAGVEARANGNLELASVYWKQIVDRDPKFGNGIAATQLESLLTQQLRPLRLQRLREQAQSAMAEGDFRRATGAWQAMLAIAPDDADITRGMRAALKERAIQAQRKGEWGEEIGAWEAMRRFNPQDPEPSERIAIAEQNQQWTWLYTNAQNFAHENKLPPAKDALETLWNKAPYFGDPASIAAIVGAKLPPSYEQIQAEQERQRKAQEELERQRKAQEAEINRLRIAREAEHERQRKAQEEKEAQRQKRPNFIKHILETSPVMVWFWALLPLIGAGMTAGIFTRSFTSPSLQTSIPIVFVATGAGILVIALLVYGIGYRRALTLPTFLGLVAISALIASGAMWLAPHINPEQLIQSHLFWVSGGIPLWVSG